MLFPYLAFSVIVTWLQPPLANKAPNFNFLQFYFQSTQFQFPPKNLVSKLQISISSEIFNLLSKRFRFSSKSFNSKRCRFQFPTNLSISEKPIPASLKNFHFLKLQISFFSKTFNFLKCRFQFHQNFSMFSKLRVKLYFSGLCRTHSRTCPKSAVRRELSQGP